MFDTLLAEQHHEYFCRLCCGGNYPGIVERLQDIIPDAERTVYIAYYNIIMNASATIAPMVAMWMLGHTTIYLALVISGTIRLLGSLAFYLQYRWEKRRLPLQNSLSVS